MNTDKGSRGIKYILLYILNGKAPFCRVCGCELLLKQKEELEKCPKGKWGREL